MICCDIIYCISLIWKDRERKKSEREREKEKQTSKETRRNSLEIFSGKEVIDYRQKHSKRHNEKREIC